MSIRTESASTRPDVTKARTTLRPVTRAFVLLAGLSLIGPAVARAADDEVWIEYRQSVMSGIGSHMGGIGDILKNGLPLTSSIEVHANALAESSALIAPAFEQKTADIETDAKPEIWQDHAKFEKAIADMKAAAEALAASVHAGKQDEIGPNVKALGQACGGCHKSFRKPKEESYKNK